jgi:RNA recognition motif-containing protein
MFNSVRSPLGTSRLFGEPDSVFSVLGVHASVVPLRIQNQGGKMKIIVGNLSANTTEGELNELFMRVGEVEFVKMIEDRDTGHSRGMALLGMDDDELASRAIAEFNGKKMDGRKLLVSEARPLLRKEFKARTYRNGSSRN